MDIKDIRSVIDIIRDASKKELIIISLPLLPILLGVWAIFLNNLNFLDSYKEYKFIAICLILIIYIIGIIYLKKSDTKNEKLKRAIYHIQTRLMKRGGHRASFEAIRNEVDESYSDDDLKKIIDMNPDIFSRCPIKNKSGEKPGITLVKKDNVIK